MTRDYMRNSGQVDFDCVICVRKEVEQGPDGGIVDHLGICDM